MTTCTASRANERGPRRWRAGGFWGGMGVKGRACIFGGTARRGCLRRVGEPKKQKARALDAQPVGRSPAKLPAQPGMAERSDKHPRLMPCGELPLTLVFGISFLTVRGLTHYTFRNSSASYVLSPLVRPERG